MWLNLVPVSYEVKFPTIMRQCCNYEEGRYNESKRDQAPLGCVSVVYHNPRPFAQTRKRASRVGLERTRLTSSG